MNKNQSVNVLVIDNHKLDERDFSAHLTEKNFNVYLADGLENGLEIAERYIPDIIISSLTTVELGKKLVSNILSQPSIRFLPVIYLSPSSRDLKEFREIMNLGAADYFPVDFDLSDLIESIKIRVKQNRGFKNQITEECQRAFEVNNPKKEDHILITVGKKLQLVKFEQIVCITAEKEYTIVRTMNGKSIIIRKSLRSWLEILPANEFLRIHRQSIINVNLIEKIEKVKPRTWVVFLKTLAKPLELSRRYSSIMRKTFGSKG